MRLLAHILAFFFLNIDCSSARAVPAGVHARPRKESKQVVSKKKGPIQPERLQIYIQIYICSSIPLSLPSFDPSLLSAERQREGRENPGGLTVKLRASPVDEPLHAGRWINSLLYGPLRLLLFFFSFFHPLFTSGLFHLSPTCPTVLLEMTEEYVLRWVLMLCCALLTANASNWL